MNIRPTTPADIPAITAIYAHAVRTGTATFELEPPDTGEVEQPLDASAQEVLMEGFRRQDEFAELTQKLPPLNSSLKMASPLRGSLRALTPEELDLLDLAVNSPDIQTVLDTTPEPDLETAQRLEGLLRRGYLIPA